MYLKFHINPPYIVYVINCILTHSFFFSVSIVICLFPISSCDKKSQLNLEARGYKTHNSFHNTSFEN